MRRDMDLVRDILLATANSREGIDATSFAGKRHDFSQVAYHMEMMKETGLIKANIIKSGSGEYIMAEARSFSWEGQDFLDAQLFGK